MVPAFSNDKHRAFSVYKSITDSLASDTYKSRITKRTIFITIHKSRTAFTNKTRNTWIKRTYDRLQFIPLTLIHLRIFLRNVEWIADDSACIHIKGETRGTDTKTDSLRYECKQYTTQTNQRKKTKTKKNKPQRLYPKQRANRRDWQQNGFSRTRTQTVNKPNSSGRNLNKWRKIKKKERNLTTALVSKMKGKHEELIAKTDSLRQAHKQ